MRVLVLASCAEAADGYASMLSRAEHTAWATVGSAGAVALYLEFSPDVLLVALDAPSSALRSLVQRVRAAAERAVPVVFALPDTAWWLRVPPGGDLVPFAIVRRAGLTIGVFEGALERLGIAPARPPRRQTLVLDATRRRLTGPAGKVQLTAAEGALAAVFLAAPGEVVDVGLLCRAIWDGASPDAHRIVALRTHVYSLRKKLATVGASDALVTEPGRGYRLALR